MFYDRFDRRRGDLGRTARICRLEIRQRTLCQPNIEALCGQKLRTIVCVEFRILEKLGFHKWKAGIDELLPMMSRRISRVVARNIGLQSSPARLKTVAKRSS